MAWRHPLLDKVTMETVTVSSKFQIVIPRTVRKELHIRPGDKLAVVGKDGVVRMVPVRPFEGSRGMFKGAKATARYVRDHFDRF